MEKTIGSELYFLFELYLFLASRTKIIIRSDQIIHQTTTILFAPHISSLIIDLTLVENIDRINGDQRLRIAPYRRKICDSTATTWDFYQYFILLCSSMIRYEQQPER